MVGPGEAPITVGAFEGFGSRVLPVVAGQLVRAGEPPLAASPRAAIRLLACTQGQVVRAGSQGKASKNR
jgi:hypothetical protein